eukprot:5578708-Alexandrium_andersonii.AAC.2
MLCREGPVGASAAVVLEVARVACKQLEVGETAQAAECPLGTGSEAPNKDEELDEVEDDRIGVDPEEPDEAEDRKDALALEAIEVKHVDLLEMPQERGQRRPHR